MEEVRDGDVAGFDLQICKTTENIWEFLAVETNVLQR
jgi:hypothetical protein